MKLFKKKQKEKKGESMIDEMPPPSAMPNQDPRYSQRDLANQDPRYIQQQYENYPQQQKRQDPRHSAPQRESYTQQQQQRPPPHQQQQQRPPPQQYREKQEYDAPPPARQQQAPPRSAKEQEYYDSLPQQQRSAPPRQTFEATQTKPKKEKAPPNTTVGIDPVVQAERAAVTRELVKQYVADIWNRGDLDLIPKICARGLRFNGSAGMDRVGHDGFCRMVHTIRDSLEDYHCEIHSMVVEGNKAFCRMRFTGRHVGQLLGYEATGKHVSWMGASEFTVMDGLICKVWELGDMASLENQLREASGRSNTAVDGAC